MCFQTSAQIIYQNAGIGAATTPDANGVGLQKALAGYASWIKPTDGGKDGESNLYIDFQNIATNQIL